MVKCDNKNCSKYHELFKSKDFTSDVNSETQKQLEKKLQKFRMQ